MFFTHTRTIITYIYVHAAVGGCGLGEEWSFTNICFSNLLSINLSFLLQQSTSSLPCYYILECACGNSATKHNIYSLLRENTSSIASDDVDTYKIRRRTLFLKSYGDAFFANASDRVGKKQIRVVLSDQVLYWRSVLHHFTIRQHFKMLRLLPSSFVTITCLDWSVPRSNNNNNNLIVQ